MLSSAYCHCNIFPRKVSSSWLSSKSVATKWNVCYQAPRFEARADDDIRATHLVDFNNSDSQTNAGQALPLTDEDRQNVEDITAESEETLREVGDSVQKDLDDLRSETEARADQLIEEETQALLDKYDDQQRQVLDNVEKEKRVIQDELDKINSFDGTKTKTTAGRAPNVAKLLFALSVLFGMASVTYAWNAITTGDQQTLYYAIVDAAVAVCASYFASLYDVDK